MLIAVGFVLSMAATWPGELSYDSVIQLLEGRTARYSGWHPPVMSWLLGISDAVSPGTGLYVFASAIALFAALASLGWIVRTPSWLGVPAAALAILGPQLVIYPGTVWKDVLFAEATVIGFVLLAHAAAQWHRTKLRIALLICSFVFLVLAALARQNGAVVLIAAASAVGLIVRQNGVTRGRSVLAGIAFLALMGGLVVGATAWLNTRVADPASVPRQVRLLQFYDLAGALAADPALPLPQLQRTQPALLSLMRSDARRLYSPAKSDTLVGSARLQSALAAVPNDALRSSWLQLIFHHTGLYLRERMAVFSWAFLTPEIARCAPYIVGQRGPPKVLEALHMSERITPRDRTVNLYGKWLLNTPVFSHTLFFVLGLVELVFLLWRRSAADLVFACMLAGAVAFCVSFFVLAIACDYRYLYPLDLSALVAAIYIAVSARGAKAAAAPEYLAEGRPEC